MHDSCCLHTSREICSLQATAAAGARIRKWFLQLLLRAGQLRMVALADVVSDKVSLAHLMYDLQAGRQLYR